MLQWSLRENDRIRSVASAVIVDAALKEGVPRVVQESFAPMYAAARYNRSALDAEYSADRLTAAGGTGVALRWLYGPDPLRREMVAVIAKGWSP